MRSDTIPLPFNPTVLAFQQQGVQRALAVTAEFSVAVCRKENHKKRQVWTDQQEVEHLDMITADSAVPNDVDHIDLPTSCDTRTLSAT